MGIEYRISCPRESLRRLEEFLHHAGAQPCAEFPERLQFRFRPSTPDEMPDATAVVESEGLYFCDHGGARAPVAILFRRIIDEALKLSDSSDSVVITSL